jgi:hypothetical protein
MPRDAKAAAWDRLSAILCDDGGRNTQDIRKDLEADGVDVDAFLARVGRTVRTSAQAAWRREAEKEKSAGADRAIRFKTEVQSLSMQEVRRRLDEAAEGKFGAQGAELAIACRNKSRKTPPTDEELRSFLADVMRSIPQEDEGGRG